MQATNDERMRVRYYEIWARLGWLKKKLQFGKVAEWWVHDIVSRMNKESSVWADMPMVEKRLLRQESN